MEYSATIFNDYSKLYLDECDTNIPWKWRAVFFLSFSRHLRRSLPYTFFSPLLLREFSSVHLSIQYHSIAENAEHVADRIYRRYKREPNYENSKSNTTLRMLWYALLFQA